MKQEQCERCGQWHKQGNLLRNICKKCHSEIHEARHRKETQEEMLLQDVQMKGTLENESQFRKDLLWLQNSNENGRLAFFCSKYESDISSIVAEAIWSDFVDSAPMSDMYNIASNIWESVDEIEPLNNMISEANNRSKEAISSFENAVNAGFVFVGSGLLFSLFAKSFSTGARVLALSIPLVAFFFIIRGAFNKFKRIQREAISSYERCIILVNSIDNLYTKVVAAKKAAMNSVTKIPGIFTSSRSTEISDKVIAYILHKSRTDFPSEVQIDSGNLDLTIITKAITEADATVHNKIKTKIHGELDEDELISSLRPRTRVTGKPIPTKSLLDLDEYKISIIVTAIVIAIIAMSRLFGGTEHAESTNSNIQIHDSIKISPSNIPENQKAKNKPSKNSKPDRGTGLNDSVGSNSK